MEQLIHEFPNNITILTKKMKLETSNSINSDLRKRNEILEKFLQEENDYRGFNRVLMKAGLNDLSDLKDFKELKRSNLRKEIPIKCIKVINHFNQNHKQEKNIINEGNLTNLENLNKVTETQEGLIKYNRSKLILPRNDKMEPNEKLENDEENKEENEEWFQPKQVQSKIYKDESETMKNNCYIFNAFHSGRKMNYLEVGSTHDNQEGKDKSNKTDNLEKSCNGKATPNKSLKQTGNIKEFKTVFRNSVNENQFTPKLSQRTSVINDWTSKNNYKETSKNAAKSQSFLHSQNRGSSRNKSYKDLYQKLNTSSTRNLDKNLNQSQNLNLYGGSSNKNLAQKTNSILYKYSPIQMKSNIKIDRQKHLNIFSNHNDNSNYILKKFTKEFNLIVDKAQKNHSLKNEKINYNCYVEILQKLNLINFKDNEKEEVLVKKLWNIISEKFEALTYNLKVVLMCILKISKIKEGTIHFQRNKKQGSFSNKLKDFAFPNYLHEKLNHDLNVINTWEEGQNRLTKDKNGRFILDRNSSKILQSLFKHFYINRLAHGNCEVEKNSEDFESGLRINQRNRSVLLLKRINKKIKTKNVL